MPAVFGRELKSYFTTLTGYLFSAFMLVFAGIYTMAYNLNFGYPNFEYALRGMSFIFMIAVPVLTMRSIADERRQRTDQLLYSMPVSLSGVVWGKYFAMLAVFALPIVIMLFYPLILSAYGTMNFATAYGSIAGFFFMGAAFIAIGLFISSLTENQAISAVLCFAVLLSNFFLTSLTEFVSASAVATVVTLTVCILALSALLYAMTKNTFAALLFGVALEAALLIVYASNAAALSGFLPAMMKKLSLFDRFNAFVDGIFDVTSLVFYAAVTFVFQYLTVQSLEKRRWI